MENKKTKELELLIQKASLREKDELFKNITNISFTDYIHQLLLEKNLEKADVIRDAQLSRTYAYQIFQGTKQAGRDKVLQLAIAMKLTLEETNRLLGIAKHARLYVKQQRDAIIVFGISNANSLYETNELLEEYEHAILGEC